MKNLARTAAAAAAAALALGLAAGPASADAPECNDAVARAIHAAHELAGPAGEPVHVVEGVYCAVAP